MRYRIEFNPKYRVSGRYVVNLLGVLVAFDDGVAYVDNERLAKYARSVRFISSVTEEGTGVSVSSEVDGELDSTPVVEEPSPYELEEELEPVPVVEESEPEPELSDDGNHALDDMEMDDESEEENDEGEEEPDVHALYEELGTWKAVAEHLGISTSTLRNIRKAQGGD